MDAAVPESVQYALILLVLSIAEDERFDSSPLFAITVKSPFVKLVNVKDAGI